MPSIKIRFHCNICKKTISLEITDEFQANFKAVADRYPYPIVVHHAGHYAMVYLDESFKERGTVVSKIAIEEK